jgi:hypothetical protein
MTTLTAPQPPYDDDDAFQRFRYRVALRMLEDDPTDVERVARYLDATEPVQHDPATCDRDHGCREWTS